MKSVGIYYTLTFAILYVHDMVYINEILAQTLKTKEQQLLLHDRYT